MSRCPEAALKLNLAADPEARASSPVLSAARAYIQLHLRDDPSDPNGYTWSPGDHQLVWDADRLYDSHSCDEGLHCSFVIIGPNPTGEFESVFYRVGEATALDAASALADAP